MTSPTADARRLVAMGAAGFGLGVVLIVLAASRHALQLHLLVGAGAIAAAGLAAAVIGLRRLRG